jgi:hypothetical protein
MLNLRPQKASSFSGCKWSSNSSESKIATELMVRIDEIVKYGSKAEILDF